MLDPDTIANAIWGQESGRGANTKTSVTGARGDMQIQPATFAQYAHPGESIDNRADNIAVGHRIIQDLYAKSGGDPARVAVGYFSGPGNIAPAGSPTPYLHNYADPNGKHTADYASDVVNRLGAPGTTINSVPMDPSILARGGVASPSSPSPPASAAPTPSLGQNIAKGDVGAALAQLTGDKKDASGKDQPGTSALDKLAGLTKGGQQQQSGGSRGGEAMLPQDSTPMIGPAAQQLMAQTFAASAKPLSWSTTPFGSGIAGPQAPGTTLNGVPPNVYG